MIRAGKLICMFLATQYMRERSSRLVWVLFDVRGTRNRQTNWNRKLWKGFRAFWSIDRSEGWPPKNFKIIQFVALATFSFALRLTYSLYPTSGTWNHSFNFCSSNCIRLPPKTLIHKAFELTNSEQNSVVLFSYNPSSTHIIVDHFWNDLKKFRPLYFLASAQIDTKPN